MLILTGCRSYNDVEDRTIVAGAAVDVLPSGELLLTAETISFGGTEKSPESEFITSRGVNIADALSQMSEKSGKELYWHHATVMILSGAYAARGLADLFDYIMNDNEVRLTLRLAVARTENARDVFQLETYGDDIKSFALTSMLEESEFLGSTPTRKAYDNINAYLEPGTEMLMPLIYEDSEGGMDCAVAEGCAVFRDGKLAGWLNRDSTEMLLLLKNEVRRMELDVETDRGLVTLMTEGWKTKTSVENGQIAIKISARYKIMETGKTMDLNTTEGHAALCRAAEDQLKRRIELLFDALCGYAVDSVGLNRQLFIKNPKEYETSENVLDYDINYTIKLRNEHIFDKIPVKEE